MLSSGLPLCPCSGSAAAELALPLLEHAEEENGGIVGMERENR
jgi:hypothetical protein